MPLTRRGIFQFGLLLLCVPAQYYLSGLSNDAATPESRQQTILNVIGEFEQFRDSWFSLEAWKETYMNFIIWIVRDLLDFAEDDYESVAIEVLQYREKFGAKQAETWERPKTVVYRVGQVVGNLRERYKGVIIGWKINSEDGLPIYTLLVDEGESNKPQEAVEVPQDDLYGIEHSMMLWKVLYPTLLTVNDEKHKKMVKKSQEVIIEIVKTRISQIYL